VIAGLPAMSQVAAGAQFAAGLTTAGAVWTWGDNSLGQDGHAGTSIAPSAVPGLPAGITQLSAGTDFTLALAPDGTVWAWGNNASGQLGRGTTGGFSATPQQVIGLPPIAQVSAGGGFALAQTADGRVFAWGSNGFGQLGTGTIGGQTGTPAQVTAIGPVASVAAGGLNALAILADGTSRVWGGNLSGQLGNNSTSSAATPVAPQLPAGSTIQSVYGASNGSVWVLTDGRILQAGDNTRGQLGTGTTGYAFVPAGATLAVTGVSFGGVAAGGVAWSGPDVVATTHAHPSGVVDTSVSWTYGTTPITVTAPASFTFGTPPTISGAAGDRAAGSVVSFDYAVAGDEAPTVTVTSGTLPPGLTLSPAGHLSGSPTTAGTYSFTLGASNGLGTATLADTIVVAALTVIQDPADQTVFEGQPATFLAGATSALTPLSVRWQSSTDGTTWTDVPGAASASYTTPATTLADGGRQFRAVFSDGASEVATAPATLTVLPLGPTPDPIVLPPTGSGSEPTAAIGVLLLLLGAAGGTLLRVRPWRRT
jgi:hypothetical protein